MKILFSPGFGAGWSTWMDDKVTKDALTYQPIIDFIEGGGQFNCRYNFDDDGNYVLDNMHPLLKQFHADMIAKHGDNIILYFGGARDLKVVEVSGQVKIEEYDGSESIAYRDADDWIEL